MDEITIDENYDDYKEEFFKGLTLRQTVFAALALGVGTLFFYLAASVLHLPQVFALYASVFGAAPFALIGFVNICDMPLLEYWKLKQQIKKSQGYLYQSEECPNLEERIQERKEKHELFKR